LWTLKHTTNKSPWSKWPTDASTLDFGLDEPAIPSALFSILFVVISGKSVPDHITIMQHIKNKMPHNPAVAHVIMDFEFSAWSTVQQEFPQAQVHGCNSHCYQAK